jgi:predicted nuclease with TOPRIM domain
MIFASSAASDPQSWLPAIIGLIVAVLGGGGVAALIRAKPEGSKILIDAAAGVVVVQTGVITDLREQLEESRSRSDSQEKQLKEAQGQIDELRRHVTEMSTLRVENDQLKSRVSHLEVDNQRLRERVAELEHHTQHP